MYAFIDALMPGAHIQCTHPVQTSSVTSGWSYAERS